MTKREEIREACKRAEKAVYAKKGSSLSAELLTSHVELMRDEKGELSWRWERDILALAENAILGGQ